MKWVILILWIVGVITAYPRHRKWCKENIEGDYDNSQMLYAVMWCIGF